MSNQGLRQASARAISGTAGTYNEDFLAMFTAEGVPVEGTFNGRFLQWLNIRLARTYTNLPEAMTAFAVSLGLSQWNDVGTFAAAVPPGPTYAQFQAHIATLAVDGAVLSEGNASATPAGKYRIVAVNMGDSTLFGSSWGPSAEGFLRDFGPAVRHGLPSPAEWTAQVGRSIYLETTSIGVDSLPAVNRNGFASSAADIGGGPYSARRIVDLLYFVDGVGAFRMNPSTGTGPTPYVW